MKKPCWIFRLLSKTDYYIKHFWEYTKPSRKYIQKYTKDLLLTIVTGLNYVADKMIQHCYIILLSILIALATIVASLIGVPLGQIILSHATMKTALYNPNLSVSFLPILKIIGVGFIGIAGCALVAFSICEFNKYIFIYFHKNIAAAKLWNRHEKHVAND